MAFAAKPSVSHAVVNISSVPGSANYGNDEDLASGQYLRRYHKQNRWLRVGLVVSSITAAALAAALAYILSTQSQCGNVSSNSATLISSGELMITNVNVTSNSTIDTTSANITAAMNCSVEVVEEDYVGAHLVQDWDEIDTIFPITGLPAKSLEATFSARYENETYAFKFETTGYERYANLPIILWIDIDQNIDTTLGGTSWTNASIEVPVGADLAVVIEHEFAAAYNELSGADAALRVTLNQSVASGLLPDSGLDMIVGNNSFTTASFSITRSALASLANISQPSSLGDLLVKFQDDSNKIQEGLVHWQVVPADEFQRNPPSCTERAEGLFRGAIAFSSLAREHFYDSTSYTMLFMAMQHQFMQAGIPLDLIHDYDLVQEEWMCQFNVIVIPYMQYVLDEHYISLRKALKRLVHRYGVSLIICNDFMTSNANNSATSPRDGTTEALLELSGIGYYDFALANRSIIYANTSSPGMFQDLAQGQVLADSDVDEGMTPYVNKYKQLDGWTGFEVIPFAYSTVVDTDGVTSSFEPILCSQLKDQPNAGRLIHFNSMDLMGDYDLIWRAIRWALRLGDRIGVDAPHVYLQHTRKNSTFAIRWDCDLTSYLLVAADVYPYMYEHYILPWRSSLDLVSSYYINLGNDPGNNRGTNWTRSKEWYQSWLDLDNELGSHSYTHPLYVDYLSAEQFDFEFGVSNKLISGNMSLSRIGAAQPGNPLNYTSDMTMQKYYNQTYFSTSVSKTNAGFEGAFGYMDPDTNMILLAPNFSFDFTLIEFKHYTPTEAEAAWLKEYEVATKFSNRPILHAGVHPYGLLSYTYVASLGKMVRDSGVYTSSMFTSLFEHAYNRDTEFVTLMELHDRIRTFHSTWFRMVQINTNTVQALVSSNKPDTSSYGTFALTVAETDRQIISVDAWYAYGTRDVFLPRLGGNFVIHTGTLDVAQSPVTRISKMSSRVELVLLQGDGYFLNATLTGPGTVQVNLATSPSYYSFIGNVTETGSDYIIFSLKQGEQTILVQ